MNKLKFHEMFDFVALMLHECPFMIREECWELMRISRALHRLNEVDCNTGLSTRQQTRREHLEHHAQTLAHENGCGLHINRDPRGPALLIQLPSGRTNDWGERGYGVPIS